MSYTGNGGHFCGQGHGCPMTSSSDSYGTDDNGNGGDSHDVSNSDSNVNNSNVNSDISVSNPCSIATVASNTATEAGSQALSGAAGGVGACLVGGIRNARVLGVCALSGFVGGIGSGVVGGLIDSVQECKNHKSQDKLLTSNNVVSLVVVPQSVVPLVAVIPSAPVTTIAPLVTQLITVTPPPIFAGMHKINRLLSKIH